MPVQNNPLTITTHARTQTHTDATIAYTAARARLRKARERRPTHIQTWARCVGSLQLKIATRRLQENKREEKRKPDKNWPEQHAQESAQDRAGPRLLANSGRNKRPEDREAIQDTHTAG